MVQNIQSIEEFHQLIQTYPLVVIHVMREHCSVCHAVLPQIQDLLNEYPHAKLGVINQSQVQDIAGELSIFTVPVDLIFMNGKEMHRQGRFIDMQTFEHQLQLMYDAIE
ncbi:thioredoxin family protein [Staphylococcus caprae]|uniref:Thioredoxin n=1 Tax=Staphylococcus caprae TaxID=29380 RepID=A0ABN5W5U3_9STAP|nr:MULTISPECIES: thioredoxin family protein [Staphylococcus]EES41718.1 hypothetical protein HMPREF0793_0620 [Staphylococcus caprae M23864:W1]MBN6826292.1 thioredoxin family protein [Staphylococcus caprae]MBX5317086.1 thioredoxin family protein [Staphylococcus caprae]MBX5323508.1 thioredoxin family protein [Staphylococcus caprae]MCI2955313.1 thioredoxin family protein [Staphylococcus caprae]